MMKQKRIWVILLLVLLFGMVAVITWQDTPASLAEGGYILVSGATAAGGQVSGGNYEMNTTIGQAEAGLLKGGTYKVGGGFWGGGPLTEALSISDLFLPVLIR
jgi:hypothetical protein